MIVDPPAGLVDGRAEPAFKSSGDITSMSQADGYIDAICTRMLPELHAQGLVDFVDAYCEAVAFTPEQNAISVAELAIGLMLSLARMISRYMGKHIPGNPTIVPSNLTGAGGNTAAAHLYAIAPKDGTVIGLFHEAQMMNQLTGGEGVNFDLRQFNWLGSSYDDPNVCIVRTPGGTSTLEYGASDCTSK